MKRIHACLLAALCAMLLTAPVLAQGIPTEFQLRKAAVIAADRPASNSAVEFLVRGDTLWVAGGKGLGYTADNGSNWTHLGDSAPFSREDIAAIAAHGGEMWISLAGSEETDAGSLAKGLGLARSTDFGRSWTRIDQPMEASDMSTYDISYGRNTIKALAVTTDINNITYDIAVTGKAVWIASFAGGLRKSTDGGATFVPVILPPDVLDTIAPDDTLQFELSPVNRPDLGLRESLNHRVFSVHNIGDDTLWVGTAGGINLSTDGGISWRKYSFNNQNEPISGNFVVAIEHQWVNGMLYVWASTVNALNPTEFRAVSFTTNMGASWTSTLRGEFANNIGFNGDVVYAATNSGVYRSDDAGKSWLGFSRFVDTRSRQVAADPATYATAAVASTIWVAGADGLMYTRDDAEEFFGTRWTILRAAEAANTPDEAYAYPNPFSPDDEPCRIRYRSGAKGTVSIAIYDFAMMPVRTVLRNASRTPGIEHDEIWNGTNDSGARVANGVYYIQLTIDDRDPVWTKIVVLQ